MKVLVADASSSEFGWELMTWQGYVRKLSPQYTHIVVCTTSGLEYLYQDFAHHFVVHNVPLERDCWKAFKVHDRQKWKAHQRQVELAVKRYSAKHIKHARFIPTGEQRFIQYGDKELKTDKPILALHARNKQSKNGYYSVYNWPLERWNALVKHFKAQGFRVIAAGSERGSFLPEGAESFRGKPLDVVTSMLRTAALMIGPSSGPMHLASLCGTPHFVWTGRQYSTTIKGHNRERYQTVWNPLKTPCKVIDSNPDLSSSAVIEHTEKALKEIGRGS